MNLDSDFVLGVLTLLTVLVVGYNFYLLARGQDDDE